MQVHVEKLNSHQRHLPPIPTQSPTTPSGSKSSRSRATTVTVPSPSPSSSKTSTNLSNQPNTDPHSYNALLQSNPQSHRAPSARSHQNLRAHPSPTHSSTPGIMSSTSRSRSGSTARYLSVNTQAASPGPVPAVPQFSSSTNVSVTYDGEIPTPTSTAPPSGGFPPATSAVQGAASNSSSASNGSPASAAASPSSSFAVFPGSVTNTVGVTSAPTPPPLSVGSSSHRERTLTHKSSSRTVGGNSIMSTNTSTTRNNRATSATSCPSGSSKEPSRTRERDRDRERDRKDPKRRGTDDTGDEEGAANAGGSKIIMPPRLPLHDAEPAPPTLMYWSRAPVWGTWGALPAHKMRSHSATVVDNSSIWLFGGCDDKEFWRDVMCLDVETMEWTRPETIGDIPPPCRAHTATLVDKRLFVFGGGQGNMYYNTLYILDTVSRRWSHVPFSSSVSNGNTSTSHSHTLSSGKSDTPGTPSTFEDSGDEVLPRPRRAHTTVLYKNKLIIFGGGNGATALNDVWWLDVSVPPERMRWTQQQTHGVGPSPRGYHTANLVSNVMVVLGGSDGRQTFADIFCLNLDTWTWSSVSADRHKRLAHTATQIGSYLFIMGGHDGSQYTNELLLFNLVSLQYEPRPSRGIAPSARGYHAAALADGRLWVFGGYDGRSAHDDVHILELASAAYLSQVTGFSIALD